MDKIAANNHIVVLKKEIKSAKAMVSGNLVRKITKLKTESESTADDKDEKLAKKIEKIHHNIRLLKTLDPYAIAKRLVLKPDPKYWEKLVGDSKAPAEDILIGRVGGKNRVQKEIARFRSQHKDCDEWLNEYFEFREKKKDICEGKQNKKGPKKRNQDTTNNS